MITACPFCGSPKFQSKGFSDAAQTKKRFRCSNKDCLKNFTAFVDADGKPTELATAVTPTAAPAQTTASYSAPEATPTVTTGRAPAANRNTSVVKVHSQGNVNEMPLSEWVEAKAMYEREGYVVKPYLDKANEFVVLIPRQTKGKNTRSRKRVMR